MLVLLFDVCDVAFVCFLVCLFVRAFVCLCFGLFLLMCACSFVCVVLSCVLFVAVDVVWLPDCSFVC